MSTADVLIDEAGIRLERDGPAMTIVLAAPERDNRITQAAMLTLIAALERATAEALVLVVRAEGDDFCRGRDQSRPPEGMTRAESLRLILRANELLGGFPGPSVALVQGHALGFGSGLALHCDITLAADDATFGFDEIHYGLAPLVVLEYLGRHVGAKLATELVLTGRPVSASEALALRMVNRLVPADRLVAEGTAVVDGLLSAPAGALRLMKAYAGDLAAGRMSDPREQAVDRLDAWLGAGRPEHPESVSA